MKGKMIIFIILLTLLIGTAYAGNNTTEIEYDPHTIKYSDNISYALKSGDSNIIDKEIKSTQTSKPKHVHINNETGNPIIILFIALFAIGIMKK